MKALHASDIKRCGLFLKVTKRVTFTEEGRWAAKGKLWVFIDEHTASAAMDMAWILQKAGLATVLGPEDSEFIGGFLLPPAQASLMLPNSGLVVRYSPILYHER